MGEASQRARIGPATTRAADIQSPSVIPAAKAIAGALHMDKEEATRSDRFV